MLIYVLFSAIIKKIMFKQTFVGGKTDLELQNELSGISRREKLCRIIREKGQITARQGRRAVRSVGHDRSTGFSPS